MLGHIKPRLCKLSSSSRRQYTTHYCSLCHSLRKQFGLAGSLFISHELTLNLIAIADDSKMVTTSTPCPARLYCRDRPIQEHSQIDRAAQFCLLLGWLKVVDWETDSPAFYKTLFRRRLDHQVKPVLDSLEAETRELINLYLQLTANDSEDFESVRKLSGLLSRQLIKELLAERDLPAPVFENFLELNQFLGETIAVADPLLDFEQDIKKRQYNPIVKAAAAHQTTIQQEHDNLYAQYLSLNNQIQSHIGLLSDTVIAPAFVQSLDNSMQALSARIKTQQQHYFNLCCSADDQSEQNANRRNRKKDGDCCDCCDCCCDVCGSTSKGDGGCCQFPKLSGGDGGFCDNCNCCDGCDGCSCDCSI